MRFAIFVLAPALCAQTDSQSAAKTAAADGSLERGTAIRGEARQQTRSYSVVLKPGQFLGATVQAVDADVDVALSGPNREMLIKGVTDDFPKKTVPVLWVAEIAGEYRVEVKAGKTTSRFEVLLQDLRPAGPRERKRAEAERLCSQAPAEAAKYNYKGAAELYERASVLFRETRDPASEQAALHHLGVSYSDLDDEKGALAAYQRALRIVRELKDERVEGRILANIGNGYSALGNKEVALTYYRQALPLFQAVGDRRREMITLVNIGSSYGYLARDQEAISHHEQGLSISRALGDRGIEGHCLYALAWDYFRIGNNDKAIEYGRQALPILREVKARKDEAWTLHNLGIVYHDMNRFDDALRYYQEALSAAREVKDRRNEAAILANIGRVTDDLGQYQQSVTFYEQALPVLREIGDRPREAVTLTDLAATYRDLKEYQKALEYHTQALSILRELKDRGFEVITLKEMGLVYADLGQPRKAIEYYDQALAVLSGIGRGDNAEVLNALGRASLSLHESAKAVSYHTQALAASRTGRNLGEESMALTGLMDDWSEQGQPRLAVFYGKQAINSLQSLRSSIRGLGRDLQKSFLKKNEKPYHTLAELLIAQGRLAEAEQVMGLLKQEEYFEYIRRDSTEGSLDSRATLSVEEAEWEQRYREVGGRLMAIGVERGELITKQNRSAAEARRLVQLDQDLQAGNIAFEKFLGDLTQRFSAKAEGTLRIEQIHETQALMEDLRDLPAGTVLIYSIVGKDRLHAILRTPDAQKAYEFPITEVNLNRKVAQFRDAVQDPAIDPRPLGGELYQIIVGPMAEDLRQAKARTLMWSLDGVLRYVPLAALYDGHQYLIEQYGLSVITLASTAHFKERPDNEWRAAGFGVTKGHDDSGPLPAVVSELAAVKDILHGEIMLDAQFTETSMRDELSKRYPVVHIASHFRFLPGDESKSFLLLGDGAHLSLKELRTLPNLFGGVQLLTLSACNTALGDGSEVESFGTLAQRQGAKAVVASLWPVADESTSRLMQEFYRIRESSAGMTKLEALREAQLELLRGAVQIKPAAKRDRGVVSNPASSGMARPDTTRFPLSANAPYAHPYYWAPFFLMGNWL